MTWLKIYFYLSAILFGLYQLGLFLDFEFHPILTNYLADFLCMPIVLYLCLIAVRFAKNKPGLKIPGFSIISLFILYSIYFELLLPPLHWRYTADPVDVALYGLGSGIFYFLQKKD